MKPRRFRFRTGTCDFKQRKDFHFFHSLLLSVETITTLFVNDIADSIGNAILSHALHASLFALFYFSSYYILLCVIKM